MVGKCYLQITNISYVDVDTFMIWVRPLMFLYIGELLTRTSLHEVFRVFIPEVIFESLLIYIKGHLWHEWTLILDHKDFLPFLLTLFYLYKLNCNVMATFNLKILQMIRNKVERSSRVLIKSFVTLLYFFKKFTQIKGKICEN